MLLASLDQLHDRASALPFEAVEAQVHHAILIDGRLVASIRRSR